MNEPLKKNKVIVIKANRLLQNLVGMGEIPEARIKKAQEELEKIDPSYEQWTRERLQSFQKYFEILQEDVNNEDAFEKITNAIMDLKANGSFFGNDNLSDLCGLLLDFIDSLPGMDEHLIPILEIGVESAQFLNQNFFTPASREEGIKSMIKLRDSIENYYQVTGVKAEIKDVSWLINT